MDERIAALLGGNAATPPREARDDQRLSEAALAELIGVSPRTVRELARKGYVSRAEPRGYWQRESVARYCAHLRDAAAARSESGTLAAERLRLTKERADEAAIKNAKLRGALLDARQVEAEWSDVLRVVRAGVLAVPARLEARAPETPRGTLLALQEEITAALTQLGGSGATVTMQRPDD